MEKKKILVPHDFSEVASAAINHALDIAETIDGEVYFLHVVAKQSAVEKARTKLNAEQEKVAKLTETPIKTIIRIGNIFEDIGDVASEIGADMIVMGTHGLRGMQFLTGSHALKVITHSTVPFIVVQGNPLRVGYNNIVVPLDLSKETKQKLAIVADMAQYFASKVHLITPRETDEYLANQLDRNLLYAEKFFAERGIQHTATVGEDKGGFAKVLQNFAKEKDADLICIMNMAENSLLGMLGSSYEQEMITNEANIPVMMVNPVSASVSGSVLFT